MIDTIKKPEISANDIFIMACRYIVEYNKYIEHEIALVEDRGDIWGGCNVRTLYLKDLLDTKIRVLNDMMPKDEDGYRRFSLKWLYDDADICVFARLMNGEKGSTIIAKFEYIK